MDNEKYVADNRELVQLFLKAHKIHDGRWGVYAEFKVGASNFRIPDSEGLVPGTAGILTKIGIEKITKDSTPAFDAADLNPRPVRKKAK